MASLHKRERSPFWYAAFTQADGSRAFRSTKKRVHRAALETCLEWERAAKLGREGRLSENQARQVVADIFVRANATALPSGTVKEFLDSWISRKGLEVAESSLVEYNQAARLFLAHLDAKAAKPIDAITAKDIGGYRAHLAKRVSGATVNKHLKILRGAWKLALREGLLRENVFERVDLVRESRSRRRAFTMDELRKILAVCTNEWRGMVMFGLYTGQRLGDLAGLTWNNLDTESGELRLITRKTDRSIIYAHHNGKGFAGDRDTRDRGAGSGVLARDFDAAAYLTDHAGDEGLLVLSTLLRNYPGTDPVSIAWESGQFVLSAEAPIERTSRNRRASVARKVSIEDHLPNAMSLIRKGAIPVTVFKERLKGTGMAREMVRAVVDMLTAGENPQLMTFESRAFKKHEKWIGTPEQILVIQRGQKEMSGLNGLNVQESVKPLYS